MTGCEICWRAGRFAGRGVALWCVDGFAALLFSGAGLARRADGVWMSLVWLGTRGDLCQRGEGDGRCPGQQPDLVLSYG